VYGLAIDANSNIVAVGVSKIAVGGNSDEVTTVARYMPNGRLDPTFGNGQGFVLTNVNPFAGKGNATDTGNEIATDVAIQADGKIVVCGSMTTKSSFNVNGNFYLVRYNPDGTLDNTFGNQSPKNGIDITTAFGGNGDYASALTMQSDGSILVAGEATNNVKTGFYKSMAVARYTSAGQLDSAFGTGGTVTLDPYRDQQCNACDVLVQSNGDIVLYGGHYSGTGATLILAGLESNGQLDTSFGNSGFAASNIVPDLSSNNFISRDLAQGANGDLLAAGTTNSGTTAVQAFLPSGAVDTSFGTAGITTVTFSSSAIPTGIAVQHDGKILVADFLNTSTGLALARFLPSNTQIGWMTAAANPVSAGANVTLTVSNISDSAYPSTTITQVSFYQDTNGNGVLDSGDAFSGTGTLNTGTGAWTFTLSTSGWARGTYTLFAQAYDGSVLYAPVSIQLTIM
jgi:uncharacterized delta-60 repeat protein